MLQEHTVAPGGRHIEILGSYNPHSKEANLKDDRIKYWVSQGAQPSNTVHNLLVRKGVIEGAKRKVKVPARNASPSESTGENSGQVETLKESTNSEKHSEAGGPAKKVEEKVEEVKAVEGEKTEEVKTEEKVAVETAPVVETPAKTVEVAPVEEVKAV